MDVYSRCGNNYRWIILVEIDVQMKIQTIWLVVEPTPLKNMSSSIGMMKFPTEWKNEFHVPNHEPANMIYKFINVYFRYGSSRMDPQVIMIPPFQENGLVQ